MAIAGAPESTGAGCRRADGTGRRAQAYSLIVLGAVIMSWLSIDRRSGLVVTRQLLTEPALSPIRRVLPPMGGLDLSPMVLGVALRGLRRVL